MIRIIQEEKYDTGVNVVVFFQQNANGKISQLTENSFRRIRMQKPEVFI